MLIGGLTLMRAVPDQALAALIRDQIVAALRKLAAPASSTPTQAGDRA